MKVAVIIARVLLGLAFTASSLFFFLDMMPAQELPGAAGQFMTGVFASGYLLQTVKVFELICGIAFLTGRFSPLATVMIFPITLNVFLFHMFLAQEGIPIAIVFLALNLLLAYAYREYYQPLFEIKTISGE